MTNYPPGVTGNEWQIAGPDEREVLVKCESEGFNLRTIDIYGMNQINAAIEDLQNGAMSPQTALSRLRQVKATIMEVDIEVECPFMGEVTVFRTDGPWTWECPVCRVTHEIEED
jgi:hypothetical protein